MSEKKLADLDDAALIAELRSRGNAVCVFGVGDIAQRLSKYEDVAALSEREIDGLARAVMATSGAQLGESLSWHGRDILDDFIRLDGSYQKGVLEAQARQAIVAEIVADLEQRGVGPSDLDDLVHDCADAAGASAANQEANEDDQEDAIDRSSRSASDINNGGLTEQVAFLLTVNGNERGRALIEVAFGDRNAPSGP